MGVTGYDFAGWATKFNIRCGDGRTIRDTAFKHCDGLRVPLVWQHNHSDIDNVLGHAILEERSEGMWAYAFCNDTPKGQLAKNLVSHKDLDMFSIYANHLTQRGGDVLHGDIKEVSLVMAGANPEAKIIFPDIAHYDEYEDDELQEAIIMHDDRNGLELYHAETSKVEAEDNGSEETIADIIETMSDKQKEAMYAVIGMALSEGDNVEHSDQDDPDEEDEEDSEETEDEEIEHSYKGEDVMKHNVFDNSVNHNEGVLSHAELKEFATAVFTDMKKFGSFRDSFLAHANDYGIKENADGEGIELLFPDYKSMNNEPDFISRNMEWVGEVMKGVHRTPFSRIKSIHANITEDDARARGYFKGKLKKEEVFTLLKRTTDPQTIYKKQKMDRDDIIDITSFDVIAWLRREMRMMLEEEIARAILIGDGRNPMSDDHISEDHVRSIYNDNQGVYTVQVEVARDADPDKQAKSVIRAMIKNRVQYKGSGNPTLFISENALTDMLLLEDGIGHSLYPTIDVLATKLRVRKIVPVELFDTQTRNGKDLVGIMVNLTDYNVGADKGGEIHNFEDFDIDYNQQKYLIETRISGALTKPYSAMVIEIGSGSTPIPNP